jgi:hypothetical protein
VRVRFLSEDKKKQKTNKKKQKKNVCVQLAATVRCGCNVQLSGNGTHSGCNVQLSNGTHSGCNVEFGGNGGIWQLSHVSERSNLEILRAKAPHQHMSTRFWCGALCRKSVTDSTCTKEAPCRHAICNGV